MVCLDVYPDEANRRWLGKDLAKPTRERPTVLFFHYPLRGPFSDWWKEEEKQAFARTIEGCNVIAIFHGHYHGSLHYRWKGYDIYNVGSPRHGMHSFAAAHLRGDVFTVASWNWGRNRWQWWHRKRIRLGPEGRPSGKPARGEEPREPAAAPSAGGR
jgi:hypothetical protein